MATLVYHSFEASGSIPATINADSGQSIDTSSAVSGGSVNSFLNASGASKSALGTSTDGASGNATVRARFRNVDAGAGNSVFTLILRCDDGNPANFLTGASSIRVAIPIGSPQTAINIFRRNGTNSYTLASLSLTGSPLTIGETYLAQFTANGNDLSVAVGAITGANAGKWLKTDGATWQVGLVSCITVTDSTGFGGSLLSGTGYWGWRTTSAAGTPASVYTDEVRLRDLTTVSVSPASDTIDEGATTNLTANNFPGGSWSSSDETKATVNGSGVVTGVAAGVATITYTSSVDPTETASSTITVTTPTGVTVDANDANWVDSPGNVDVQSSSLCVLTNWGAERRIAFTGTSCVANFSMATLEASALLSTNYPRIAWKIDEGDWEEARVAASVQLADGLSAGTHTLRLMLAAAVTLLTDGVTQVDRWTTPVSAARLTSLTLDVGAASATATSAIAAKDRKILFFGNSMTAGSHTLGEGSFDVDYMDGRQTWAYVVANSLNAEYGNCAWNGQSYPGGGTGNVPKFYDGATPANSTYRLITAGRSRSLTGITDVWLSHGVIEASDPTDDVIDVLTDLRSLLPAGAKMWQLIPFGGRWRAEITAAVASYKAGASDELCYLIDLGEDGELGLAETAGEASGPTDQSLDGYHPDGPRQLELGAMVYSAVRAVEGSASAKKWYPGLGRRRRG